MQNRNEKRPRHWASEIASLPTREQRQARLNQAPQHWRELIKTHLKILGAANDRRSIESRDNNGNTINRQ
jgi:hypothetical protein